MPANPPATPRNEADAGWDDVAYDMVTRREIELGLADSEANRTTPVEDVAKEFGLEGLLH